MATADPIPNLTGLDKSAQLDALRKRMATIPGRRYHAPAELPTEPAPLTPVPPPTLHAQHTAVETRPEPPTPAVRTRTLRTIPVPLPMAELLPHGALARGTALSATGAGSVLAGLVAAASAAGHHIAVIGQPRFGLLAVHEQGGDLTKVALVDPGDSDPLDAASICIDGVDLVISTVHGRDVPPTRARALLARTRTHAGIFVITDGHMPGLDLTIASRLVGYGGIEQGRGRLRSVTIETAVHGRGISQRTNRYTLTAPTFGDRQSLHWSPVVEVGSTDAGTPRRLAAAQ